MRREKLCDGGRAWKIAFTALALLAASQLVVSASDYSISTGNQVYSPGEDVFVFVNTPPNTPFTLKLYHNNKLMKESEGMTSLRGNSYIRFNSLIKAGKYEVKLYEKKSFKASASFTIRDIEACPSCVKATSTTLYYTSTSTTTSLARAVTETWTSSSTTAWATTMTTSSPQDEDISFSRLDLTAVDFTGAPRRNNHFGLSENPSFSFKFKKKVPTRAKGLLDEAPKTALEAEVFDSNGNPTGIGVDVLEDEEGGFVLSIPKSKSIKAGFYKLRVKVSDEGNYYLGESVFAWGLVSLNTRKSIYRPGEQAEFILVVLDKFGRPLCDADINLKVTDPMGGVKTYSTGDGGIAPDEECGLFTAVYPTSIEGNHSIDVTTIIDGKDVFFTTHFLVSKEFDFDIIRNAKSKIDPTKQKLFNVEIDIEPYIEVGALTIQESVPFVFEVYTDALVEVQGDSKILTWTINQTFNKTTVAYSYSVPNVWPILYELGPVQLTHSQESFSEARPWYVAVDPATQANLTLTEDAHIYLSTGGPTGRHTYAFIEWDLSTLPSYSSVTFHNATLYLTRTAANGDGDLVVYRISDSGCDVTNDAASTLYGYSVADYTSFSGLGTGAGTDVLDVSTIVQNEWSAASSKLCIRMQDPDKASNIPKSKGAITLTYLRVGQNNGAAASRTWDSQEGTTAPYLTVFYTYDAPPEVTSLDAPTNDSSLSSFPINFNFTVSDDEAVGNCTLYTNFTGSWAANKTLDSVTNGVMNNISVSSLNVGRYMWNVECLDNASTPQSDRYTYNYTFTLWGFVNISESNLDPSSMNNGSSTIISCRIVDNQSGSAIENYNVSFYHNVSGFLGWNITNSTGWASLNFTDTTSDPPQNYTITCNITNEANLLYNASTVDERNETLQVTGPGADVSGPSIVDVSATPQVFGYAGNTTIEANATDTSGVSSVWVNITYPNSTIIFQQMSLASGDVYQYNFTSNWLWGTYDFYVWANDTVGNADTSSTNNFYLNANVSLGVMTVSDIYDPEKDVNLTSGSKAKTASISYDVVAMNNDSRENNPTEAGIGRLNGSSSTYNKNSSSGQLLGNYDDSGSSSGGGYLDTWSDDTNYWWVGSDNNNHDIDAWIQLTYDITSLGIDSTYITNLSFKGVYCHDGVDGTSCSGTPADGTANGDQDVQVYDWLSETWVDIGNLATDDGGNTVIGAFSPSSGFSDFVNSTNDEIQLRYEMNYTGSGNEDSFLVLDHAPLTISYMPYTIKRYYVKFDVSNIPDNATILSANLSVTVVDADAAANGSISHANSTFTASTAVSGIYADGQPGECQETNPLAYIDASSTGTKTVDVTESVNESMLYGETVIAYFINETEEDTAFSINGSSGGNPPTLTIVFSKTSVANNTGATTIQAYLFMTVDENSTGSWQIESVRVNETTTRSISSASSLDLASIWNADPWNTDSVAEGWYRAYAELRDGDDNVLNNDDGTYMNDSYAFQVRSSAPVVENLTFTSQTIGYGLNVTIDVDVHDPTNDVDAVFLSVWYPNSTLMISNASMSNSTDNSYQYNVTGSSGDDYTWIWGNYSVTVYANDSSATTSEDGFFYVRANMTVNVETINESYGAKEYVNITEYVTYLSGWQKRKQINVTEPGLSDRLNWPVDAFVEVSNTSNCSAEFRVTDSSNNIVAYTVYNETYVDGNCTSANVVFLVNTSQDSMESYLLYYNNTGATQQTFPNWQDSCDTTENASNCSNIYYSRYDIAQGLDSWDFDNPLTLGDDTFTERSLPFAFPYFNDTYSTAYVTDNGYVDFTDSSVDATPTQAEFITRAMIAPLWDNEYPPAGGDVYENSYADRIVWTWDTVTYSTNLDVIFQAVLYTTGDIMFRYETIEGFYDANHLAGIANDDSTNFLNSPHGNYTLTQFFQYSSAGTVSVGVEEDYDRISKVVDTGSTNSNFFILARVQQNASGGWINSGTPVIDDVGSGFVRYISSGSNIYFDTIWDDEGGWNTQTLDQGLYRVYVELRDYSGTVLRDDLGSDLIATYNFTIIEANLSLYEVEHENEIDYSLNEYETGDNIAWINITVNTSQSLAVNANISLNVLKQGDQVSWGPDETQACGDIASWGTCEKQFDNSTNGYPIPTDATSGVYSFNWNLTMSWDNGGTSINSTETFTVHHIPDNISSTLSPNEMEAGQWSYYNFTITNPWSANLTGVNVSINCPWSDGFNCSCLGSSDPYCYLDQVENLTSSLASFNISANSSTSIGDYVVSVNLTYTNPGSESHIWTHQENQTQQIREVGLAINFYEYPTTITRGDGVLTDLRMYLNNTAAATQTNGYSNWTLPSGWYVSTGSEDLSHSDIPQYNVSWHNMTVNVSISANLGPQEIQMNATSDQSNDWDTFTVTVYANTTLLGPDLNDTSPTREDSVKIWSRLYYDNGTLIPNQIVTFRDETDSIALGSVATDSQGWANLTYSFPTSASVGTHTINTSFTGNSSLYVNFVWNTTNISIHDKPFIYSTSATPQTLGYGYNTTIQTNVTDGDNVSSVYVNLTYPNGTSSWLAMTNTSGLNDGVYQFNFSNTWARGNYSFYVWANDSAGETNTSASYEFYVKSFMLMRVQTVNDSYGADERVNLTETGDAWWNTSWGYRKQINVTEPNVGDRVNWPVNVFLNVNYTTNCTKEFRIVDNNTHPVIYKVYNETYDGYLQCRNANVVFLVNITQNTERTYYLYYDNDDAVVQTYNIWQDSCDATENSSNCSSIYYSRQETTPGSDSWTTATRIVNADDGRIQVNLQWNFTYFNKTYDTTYAVSNGFLDFTGSAGNDLTNLENEFLTYYMVAPLWDDLDCARREGLYQNDYADRTVFTWRCSLPTDNANDHTVQAVLYQTGDIMLRYADFVDDSAYSPTAGISNGDSTNYYHNPWGNYSNTAFYQFSGAGTTVLGEEESIIPSQVSNIGETSLLGYLFMKVQSYDSGVWSDVETIVNDATPRNFTLASNTGLNQIWDGEGGFNTNDYASGTYRVYSALRDPSGNILTNDDGVEILADYNFTITGEPPIISDVSATPQTIGYDMNVTLEANVTDNGNVSFVYVNITYPNSTTIWEQMSNISASIFQYNFTDTWSWGNYSYNIWANDTSGSGDSSAFYEFFVRANATFDLQTLEDDYGANEDVNLTDASNVNNTGPTNMNDYVTMKIQRNDTTSWTDVENITHQNFTYFSSGSNLNLSGLWNLNGGWNTVQESKDIYRVYVELTDNLGNILVNDTGGDMTAWYEFNITPPVVPNITSIRIYNVTGAANTHTDTSNLIASDVNTTFNLLYDDIYRVEITMEVTDDSGADWDLSATSYVFHDNLDSSWVVNTTDDIWYTNHSQNYSGGAFSAGNLSWNTTQGGKVSVGQNATFYYIVNLSDSALGARSVIFNVEDSNFEEMDYSVYFIRDDVPPNLFNTTYGLNITSFMRGYPVLVYARWDDTINFAYVEYNSTSTTTSNYTVNLPATNNQNWTNHTIGTDATWLLGRHVVTFYVNDSYNNWNTTLWYLNFTIYGWSKINDSDMSPTLINQSNATTMSCQVTDPVTNVTLSGYTVSFYNSTSLLGTNTTNNTGWAEYTFVDNSPGYENITCNITDDASLFYYIISPYSAYQTLFTAEIEPPTYTNLNPANRTTVYKNDTTTISADWQDNFALGFSWLATNESGTWVNHTTAYSSIQSLSGTSDSASFNWTNVSVNPGMMAWVMYGNDSSGNLNQTNVFILDVWGWSYVHNSTLSPDTIEESNSTNMSCQVKDAHTLENLENFPVYFYNSTDDLGMNTTNSDGWAILTFQDYSTGKETISCYIYENYTFFYNVTPDYFAEEELTTQAAGGDITPPLIFNGNYGLNQSTIYKGDVFFIYGQWNEGINESITEFNWTTGLENATLTLPNPNPQNWTNHTFTTNSSWNVGYHVARLYSMDASENWNDTMDYLNFTVWSWSQIDWLSPTGNTTRGDINLKCNVTDNMSYAGIESYTVSFYNATYDLLGSNDTGSDGIASFHVNTSTYDVSETNFTCRISNEDGLYYKKTSLDEDYNILDFFAQLYTNIDYPANGSLFYRGETVNLNSSTYDEVGEQVATDSTLWYNSTGTQIASGENTTWTIPSAYPLGLEDITVNASKSYYYDGINETTLQIYGWSEAAWDGPDGGSFVQGSLVNLSCTVNDSNSSQAIEGYWVSFYNGTGGASVLLGTNTTNASGTAVYYWDTTNEEITTYYPSCNITENSTMYYNLSSDNGANTTITLITGGYLEAIINYPPTNTNVAQNRTFTMNATVTCRDTANCGNVDGVPRYNSTSPDHDSEMPNMTDAGCGSSPFCTTQASTKDCSGNPLAQDESCVLTWTVNASGSLDTSWMVGVKFTSQFASTVTTGNSQVNIKFVLILNLSDHAIDWGNLDPGTVEQPAPDNPIYITIDENSNDANGGIYIKGSDLTSGSNAIGVGNITWATINNVGVGSDLTTGYQQVLATAPSGTNQSTYYWLDIPAVYPGLYTGTITVMANATY